MVVVNVIKDVIDYVYDNVPVPDGVTTIDKFKYRSMLGNRMLKDKYVAVVKPFRIESRLASRASTDAEFTIIINCAYFVGSVDIVTAHEGLLDWLNDVFDKFHLTNLGGLVDVVDGDVSFDTRDTIDDAGAHLVTGAIGLRVRKHVFKS